MVDYEPVARAGATSVHIWLNPGFGLYKLTRLTDTPNEKSMKQLSYMCGPTVMTYAVMAFAERAFSCDRVGEPNDRPFFFSDVSAAITPCARMVWVEVSSPKGMRRVYFALGRRAGIDRLLLEHDGVLVALEVHDTTSRGLTVADGAGSGSALVTPLPNVEIRANHSVEFSDDRKYSDSKS